MAEIKLRFLRKIINDIKTNKLALLPDALAENKADPYNERQTVDIDVEVEYKAEAKNKKNKKSRYGSW